MKLSVAANWDTELLEGLAEIPEVDSVYAKLPFDLVGGGRAGSVLPSVDWAVAKAYVRAAQELGISFCYLLNAPCLGNMERTLEGRRSLIDFVGQLVDLGVDSVSISNLSLLALVRRNFPDLSCRGSVLSWPTNLARLKYQESLGVDPLVLPYSEFNRDFAALQRIGKGLSCGTTLFANISCIYHCHYLAEHACSVGHASQDEGRDSMLRTMIDPYLWQCTRRRLVNPELFLTSRWIRPEDLHVYEELGFHEFKIIDRSRSTAWLLRAARAYADRRHDGNLLDIVSLELLGDPAGFHPDIEEQSRKELFSLDREERRLMLRMFRLRKRLLELEVTVDNGALNGFLDGFRRIRCSERFCSECRYCHGYADVAVHYDRDEAARLVEEIDELVEGFLTALW